MIFKALDPNQNAVTCFTGMNLLEYGVKQEILTKHAPLQKENNSCYKIEEWVENAFYEFDTSRLRVDISIPQVALQKCSRLCRPSVWDRGINAGFCLIVVVRIKLLISLVIEAKRPMLLWELRLV